MKSCYFCPLQLLFLPPTAVTFAPYFCCQAPPSHWMATALKRLQTNSTAFHSITKTQPNSFLSSSLLSDPQSFCSPQKGKVFQSLLMEGPSVVCSLLLPSTLLFCLWGREAGEGKGEDMSLYLKQSIFSQIRGIQLKDERGRP